MLSAMLAVCSVQMGGYLKRVTFGSHNTEESEKQMGRERRGKAAKAAGGVNMKSETLLPSSRIVPSSCRTPPASHLPAPFLAADPLVQQRCTAAAARTHGLAGIGNRAPGRAISLVLGDMAEACSYARGKSFPPAPPPPPLVRGELPTPLHHDRTFPRSPWRHAQI